MKPTRSRHQLCGADNYLVSGAEKGNLLQLYSPLYDDDIANYFHAGIERTASLQMQDVSCCTVTVWRERNLLWNGSLILSTASSCSNETNNSILVASFYITNSEQGAVIFSPWLTEVFTQPVLLCRDCNKLSREVHEELRSSLSISSSQQSW